MKILFVALTFFSSVPTLASDVWVCRSPQISEEKLAVQFGLNPFYVNGYFPNEAGEMDELKGQCQFFPGQVGGTGLFAGCNFEHEDETRTQVSLYKPGNADEGFIAKIGNSLLPCSLIKDSPPGF